ncbi:MAG: hypothetical protein ABIK09_19695 [Pseudomonadota bacterium]
MTVLMDGEGCADPAFACGGRQPAVLIRLTEPDGRTGVLLIDVGNDPTVLEGNLDAWFNRQGLNAPLAEQGFRTAIYFSHDHTFAPLMGPPSVFRSGPPRCLALAWKFMGEVPIQNSNLPNICHEMKRALKNKPSAQKICATVSRLPRGLTPVVYSDGVPSRRAWTYSYEMIESDGNPPFRPRESVFLLRSGDGYLVYSTCAHAAAPQEGGRPSTNLHAAASIRDLIDAGKLPDGPIHTLVTGSCGMQQRIEDQNKGTDSSSSDEAQLWRDGLRSLAARIGLRRVYLSHCSLSSFRHIFPIFQEIFGENVFQAVPGSSIRLEDPAPARP